jgi:hypothetical protein
MNCGVLEAVSNIEVRCNGVILSKAKNLRCLEGRSFGRLGSLRMTGEAGFEETQPWQTPK